MKKEYEKPEMIIALFQVCDVITLSEGTLEDEGYGDLFPQG